MSNKVLLRGISQNSHSTSDGTSQDSDVLFSLDAAKCRPSPKRSPSTRRALNFGEKIAENTTESPTKGVVVVVCVRGHSSVT